MKEFLRKIAGISGEPKHSEKFQEELEKAWEDLSRKDETDINIKDIKSLLKSVYVTQRDRCEDSSKPTHLQKEIPALSRLQQANQFNSREAIQEAIVVFQNRKDTLLTRGVNILTPSFSLSSFNIFDALFPDVEKLGPIEKQEKACDAAIKLLQNTLNSFPKEKSSQQSRNATNA